MRASRFKDFLDTNRIHYSSIVHPTSYTAQGTAAYAHVSGKEMAKTVIVRIDTQLAMAVLPASAQLDLSALKKVTKAKTVSLAPEPEFEFKFPDCDLGAMPPFGNLYGVPVYVDERLAEDPSIVFPAGMHTRTMSVNLVDYLGLVQPVIADLASHP